MKRETKTQLFAKLALFAATLIWGSSFVLVKNTVEILPPNFFVMLRFIIAAVFLNAAFYKRFRNMDKKYIGQGAVAGFFLFCAYCFQTIGISGTTPGKNAFLTTVYCVIVPFLFWLTNKNRPDGYNISAALICMAGIGLVSLDGSFAMCRGDLFTLIGGFFYAAHMVALAKVGRGRDPILLTVWQFYFAAAFAGVYTLLFEPKLYVFNSRILFSLAYMAIGCTAVALLFQTIGQKHTHPSAAAIILSFESVFGVIFSIIFYHETVTLKLAGGFALIFLSVLISETKLSFLKKAPQIKHAGDAPACLIEK